VNTLAGESTSGKAVAAMDEILYSNERNAQIVVALLKAHGIRRVVVNPGTGNMTFVGSVQNDPWFKVFSCVDERHAGYMAVGMAAESGEPVVLSCTGATASRNYLPALTEAYYRKLPVLAITSTPDPDMVGNLFPQVIDRSRPPVDAVRASYTCRVVRDDREAQTCERKVNAALLELWRHGGGPVHLNLETGHDLAFGTRELPPVRKMIRIEADDAQRAPELPEGAKIAIFAGAGRLEPAWEAFAAGHNVAVFSDEAGCYEGVNRVHASLACSQIGFRLNPEFDHLTPDLVIDAGEVSGDYPVLGTLTKCPRVWRVSQDGEIRARFGNPEAVFEMSAARFSAIYPSKRTEDVSPYARMWMEADAGIRAQIPELPFSNAWMAQQLSPMLPPGSVLHLGILNSLRSWNIFPAPKGVRTSSNVGGFGIDGCVSTLLGSSLASPDKLHFGVVGDLAFFYDLNALGNRHRGKNLRLLLINNGCGAEFNLYFHPAARLGDRVNEYIAAGHHFGDRSRSLVQHYAEDLGFRYMSAGDKGEFMAALPKFTAQQQSEGPLILECFTTAADESEAHRLINSIRYYEKPKSTSKRIKDWLHGK